jgi:hypothetical protein
MTVETALSLLARRCNERAGQARDSGRERAAQHLEQLATCFEQAGRHPAAQPLERRLGDIHSGRFPDSRFWDPAESGDLTDCETAITYLGRL